MLHEQRMAKSNFQFHEKGKIYKGSQGATLPHKGWCIQKELQGIVLIIVAHPLHRPSPMPLVGKMRIGQYPSLESYGKETDPSRQWCNLKAHEGDFQIDYLGVPGA